MGVRCTTCDKACSFRKEPFNDEHAALLARHDALKEAVRGLLGSLDNGEFKTTITHSVAAEMAEKVYRINRAEVDRLVGEG